MTSTQESPHDTYVAAVQLHAEKLQTVATTTDAKKLLQAEAEAQIIERDLPALREAHEAAVQAEQLTRANWFAEQSLLQWKASETALRSAVANLNDAVRDTIDAALQHASITQNICNEASSHQHPGIQTNRFSTRIDQVTIQSHRDATAASVAKVISPLMHQLGWGVVGQDLDQLARSNNTFTIPTTENE